VTPAVCTGEQLEIVDTTTTSAVLHHYTLQFVLVVNSNKELENYIGAEFYCLHFFASAV